MSAYYNEIDPFAAQWLRNLIAAGHIAPGDVDERSITEVRPDDLRPYTQCHFFAGIGGWSYALRLAGWPDARPVWTGSCPCQPFSAAGKQRGSEDERHLWPAFFDLISECRPGRVFGEQVAGAAGLAWLDHVCADLEGAGYAAAAADLCAAGAGAFHIRQRLYWVAHDNSAGRVRLGSARVHERRQAESGDEPAQGGVDRAQWNDADGCGADGVGNAAVALSGVGDASRQGPQEQRRERHEPARSSAAGIPDFWADVEWIPCRDGKARPTQPGLFPLAHGVSNRVGRLRAYGNAIVPQVAAAFIEAAT